MRAIAVLDIGKTNVKVSLLDHDGVLIQERRLPNQVLQQEPFPHYDVDGIFEWLLQSLAEFSRAARVEAIVPVTHGATAAIVDDSGLLLPVLDYEHAALGDENGYGAMCPEFRKTFSPRLPAGLNLGRQLWWLARTYPEKFRAASHVLLYPQYWAWRLCGTAASEVTSLGCHTDLWEPRKQDYSGLAHQLGLSCLLPPLRRADDVLGSIHASIAKRTGLPGDCKVICGIHDSNASLLRYLRSHGGPRTIISSGTWTIIVNLDASLDVLEEKQDMLANVDMVGRPVPSMRFMGGREFAALAGNPIAECSLEDLQRVVSQRTLALPAFAETGGPFSGRDGRIAGPAPANDRERYALATLYSVLMTGYCLRSLRAAGEIAVEGSFAGNPFFAGLLAHAAGECVMLSSDASGSLNGAWALAFPSRTLQLELQPASPIALEGWDAYAADWYQGATGGLV